MKDCNCKPPYFEPNHFEKPVFNTNINTIIKRLYSKCEVLEDKLKYLENNCGCSNVPNIPDSSEPVNPPSTDTSFTISIGIPNTLVSDSDASEYDNIITTSNEECNWTISTPSWITISPSTGTGTTNINIKISENTSTSNRVGSIIVTATVESLSKTVTYTVNQKGVVTNTGTDTTPTEKFEFNAYISDIKDLDNNFSVIADSTVLNAVITANSKCIWNIASSNFISCNYTKGTGSLSGIKITVNSNPNYNEREGWILFTGSYNGEIKTVEYTFTQAAKAVTPILTIDETSLKFTESFNEESVLLTTNSNDYKIISSGNTSYFSDYVDDEGVNDDGTIWKRLRFYANKENDTVKDITATYTFVLGSITRTLTLTLVATKEEETPSVDTTYKFSYYYSYDKVTDDRIEITSDIIKTWANNIIESTSSTAIVNKTISADATVGKQFVAFAVPANWDVKMDNSDNEDETEVFSIKQVAIKDPYNSGSSNSYLYNVYYYEAYNPNTGFGGEETFTLTVISINNTNIEVEGNVDEVPFNLSSSVINLDSSEGSVGSLSIETDSDNSWAITNTDSY